MTTTNSKDFSLASSIVGQKRRFFPLIGGAALREWGESEHDRGDL